MPSNSQGNGTWASDIDMDMPGLHGESESWGQGDWATTSDLVNSILGATGKATVPANPPSEIPQEPPAADEADSGDSQPLRGHDGRQSEYGAWEPRRGTSHADGFQGEQAQADAHGEAWQVPPAVKEPVRHGGPSEHYERNDRAGRRGRFTSAIAIVLAVVAIAVALSPVLFPAVDQDKWLISLVLSLPMVAVIVTPAMLLGLRSATKPKGQLGKKRGVASVIMCSVALVTSVAVVTLNMARMIGDLNESGLTAKEQTDQSSMTILFPGGKLTLSNKAITLLMKAKILPDNTLDNGAIPLSSSNGKVYVGSRELDATLISEQLKDETPEASQETLDSIAAGVEALAKQGIRITTDGKSVTLRFQDGTSRRITSKELENLKDFTDSQVLQPSQASQTSQADPTNQSDQAIQVDPASAATSTITDAIPTN